MLKRQAEALIAHMDLNTKGPEDNLCQAVFLTVCTNDSIWRDSWCL